MLWYYTLGKLLLCIDMRVLVENFKCKNTANEFCLVIVKWDCMSMTGGNNGLEHVERYAKIFHGCVPVAEIN